MSIPVDLKPSTPQGSPWRRVAQALFLAGIALGLYYGLFSKLSLSHRLVPFARNDNLEHVCAFGFLAVTGLWIWPAKWRVALGLIAAAGLLELLQIPSRAHAAHWSDWGFSSLGVVLGVAFVTLLGGVRALVTGGGPSPRGRHRDP